MNATDTTTKFFYGWVVVLAVFVITLIGFGSAYSFSSFLEPLQDEFGASRGSVSLVFSLAGFLYFGLGIISGPLADRWGARRLAALGMVLIGVGLILAAQAHSLLQVYIAYSIGIGVGVGCAYVPTVGAVQRWFVKKRGLASGLAVSGIGVGTLVMPPLAAWLIADTGWRHTYLMLGIFVIVAGLGAAFFMADNPHEKGTGPDGERLDPISTKGVSTDDVATNQAPAGTVTAPATAVIQPGMPLREAIVTPRFIGLYAAGLASSLGVFVPFVHLVPYAADHGIPATTGALLIGMIGVGSTAGRLFLGGIADRLGRDQFLVGMYLGMAVSLAIWALAGGVWALAGFAFLFGVFYGGWVAILPAVVADHFGGRSVSGIIGALYTSAAVGTLLGPTAAGFAFDFSHSYTLPIVASVIANLAAAGITLLTVKGTVKGTASGTVPDDQRTPADKVSGCTSCPVKGK